MNKPTPLNRAKWLRLLFSTAAIWLLCAAAPSPAPGQAVDLLTGDARQASGINSVAPVTIKVVDGKGGATITNFTYTWWVVASATKAAGVHEGVSSNGQFVAHAPARCRLDFDITGPGLLSGYHGNGGSFHVDETNRLFVYRANRGVRVRGIVVSSDSGQPISEVEVAPIVFCPPLFIPDPKRRVRTDSGGQFQLEGVDRSLGVGASHPSFVEQNHGFNLSDATELSDDVLEVLIKLERGKVLNGTVRDSQENLLSGVRVTTGNKEAMTGTNGKFHLTGLPTRTRAGGPWLTLSLEKPGFVKRWFVPVKFGAEHVELRMKPEPKIVGRVVGPDNKPVAGCVVWAGPDQEPPDYACRMTNSGPDGTFELSLEERCKTNWVGVSAPGFAPWFGNVLASNLKSGVVCRLGLGTEVKLTCSGMATNLVGLRGKLRLQPVTARRLVNPDDASRQQLLATFEACPDADGVIRFHHVPPGHYRVGIRGPAISPTGVDATVGDSPVDLGEVQLHGTGTVAGRILSSEKDLVTPTYAQGEVEFSGTGLKDEEDEPISFTADAAGFFRIEHVPVGDVTVLIPYSLSADMRSAIARHAHVTEGKTTEMSISAGERDADRDGAK